MARTDPARVLLWVADHTLPAAGLLLLLLGVTTLPPALTHVTRGSLERALALTG